MRESEEMYRTLVKTSPDAVTVTDLKGNITFVSNRTLEVHGFEKAEELIGKSAFELIAPENHEEAMINLKKTLKEGFLRNLEYTLLRKDGTSFIGELNTALIKDAYGKPKAFIATTRDVTERKRTEEALREEKRRYRALFERTNDAVFIINLEGIHLEVNQQAADMLGYKIDEIVGRSFKDFISPDEYKDADAKKKALLAGKTLPVYERTFRRKDGTEFPAEINIALVYDDKGKPLHFHSVVRDITERKQAEEALQRNEEKYRTILENIEDGYYEVDIAGNFTFFNDSLCRLLGYPKDELMGMNNRQYMDRETAKIVYKTFNKIYRTGKPTKVFGWEIIRKDGTRRFIEGSVSLISDSTGKPVGFRGIVRDITERKRTEEKLSTIYDLSREMSLSLNLEKISNLLLKASEKVLEFSNSALLLLDEKENELYVTSMIGYKPSAAKERFPMDGSKGIIGWVGMRGKSLLIPDVRKDKRYFKAYPKTKSELCVPIKVRGKVVGVLNFESERLNSFAEEDKKLAEALASQAAVAIENARFYERLKELKEFNEKIIQTMDEGILIENSKGLITFVNKRTCEMLSYSEKELVGKRWSKIVPKEFIPKMEEETKKRPKGIRSQYEAAILSKDGKKIPIIVTATPLFENGNFKGVLSVFTDIGERKKLEDEIRNTKNYMESVIQNSGDGIFVCDMKGVIKTANYAMEKITGLKAEKIVGKKTSEIFRETIERESIISLIEEACEKGSSYFEVSYKNYKGEELHIGAKMSPLKKEDSPYAMVGIVRDITERKKREDEILYLKEFSENIINTMNEGIWVEDSEGFCTFANPRLVKMMGYSDATELLGKHWREVVHPKEAEHVRKETDKRPLGISSSYETILLAKDGREVPALVSATPMFENGKYIGTTAVQVNMTEQKELEREIKKTRDYLESLLESTIDAIVTTDEHGRITFFSRGAEEIFGYESEKIIGEHVSNYYLGGKEEAIKIMKLLSSKGRLRNYELEIKASDRILYANSSISLLKDDKGEIVGTLGVIRDVTEEKKVREKLEAIYDLSRKMTLSLNLDEVLETALNVVHDVLNFNLISISLVDEEREEIYIKIQKGYPEKFKNLRFPLYGERGIITWVAREGKPLIVSDVSKDKRYVEADQNIKSELAVPMKVGEKILGVLNVESEDFNAFSEEDKRLLETLASRTAIAIENAKLHESEKEHSKMLEEKVLKKTKKTEALLETSFKLREETSWERGLQVILEGITKGLGFDNAYLFLVNERRGILECEANISNYQELAKVSIPLNDEGYISIQCLREKKPINIKDAFKDERVKKQIGREIKAFAWIPLLAKDEVLGLIAVDNEESGREITKEDIDSLVLFANQSAIFIDKMRYLVEPTIEKRLPTKLKYDLSSMESYLILEERSEKSFAIFVDMVTHGIQGFCVSRMHPKVLKRRYGLKKTPMIWLSNIGVRESIDSQDLGKMTHIVSEFLKRAQDSVVLLEGVEYLITENSFERVLKMLHSLNDQIMITNARLLLPLNPKTLSEREFNILKKDFRVLEVS
ncbi:MAG: PAS domain S-box protein [Candidatus Methanofastidiosia archaeon]